jgi:hypothetical protein
MSWDDFMDLNGDGEIDGAELEFAEEILGGGYETYSGGYSDDSDDELEMAGLDPDELEMMDDDERREAIEDAGLDPDDFDF